MFSSEEFEKKKIFFVELIGWKNEVSTRSCVLVDFCQHDCTDLLFPPLTRLLQSSPRFIYILINILYHFEWVITIKVVLFPDP